MCLMARDMKWTQGSHNSAGPARNIAHNGRNVLNTYLIFFLSFRRPLLADMFKMAIEPRDFIPPRIHCVCVFFMCVFTFAVKGTYV